MLPHLVPPTAGQKAPFLCKPRRRRPRRSLIGDGPASLCRVIDEATRWRRFAALLPSADAAAFVDCWDIGEQEAGLDQLVAGLLEQEVPISETVRAEIAVAAEVWGMRTALAPRLGRCLGAHQEDNRLKFIEDGLPAGQRSAPPRRTAHPAAAGSRAGAATPVSGPQPNHVRRHRHARAEPSRRCRFSSTFLDVSLKNRSQAPSTFALRSHQRSQKAVVPQDSRARTRSMPRPRLSRRAARVSPAG